MGLFFNSKNKKGFTIIPVLIVGLVINLSIQFILVNQTLQLRKISLKNDLIATEQQLINEMDTLAYFNDSIVEDAIQHSQLKGCFEDDGVLCEGRGAAVQDLSITLSDGHILVKDGEQCVSSTGVVCTCSPDGRISYHCPFKKTVKVTPLCYGNNSECDIAEGLLFSFKVEIQEDIKKEYGLSEIEKDLYTSISVGQGGWLSTICPSGKAVISFNSDGSVNCRDIYKDIYIRHFHFIPLGIGNAWPLDAFAKRLMNKAIEMIIDEIKDAVVYEIKKRITDKLIKALESKLHRIIDSFLDRVVSEKLSQRLSPELVRAVSRPVKKAIHKELMEPIESFFDSAIGQVIGFVGVATESTFQHTGWGTQLKNEIDDIMNSIGKAAHTYTERLIEVAGLDQLGDGLLQVIDVTVPTRPIGKDDTLMQKYLLKLKSGLKEDIEENINKYLTADGVSKQVKERILDNLKQQKIQGNGNVYYDSGKFSFTF